MPFTQDDLNTLKANLNAEPWKTGYAALVADSHSQLGYTMQGPFATVQRNPDLNLTQWRNDMTAIYNLALMWYFTGNTQYAQKSHDILLSWANTQTVFGGGEAGLDLGDYVYCYAVGADILRGTWPGWAQADTDAVEKLFLNVYWPATGVGWNCVGPANKGTLVTAAGAGIAAFCDDQAKLNHIADLVRTSASSGLLNILPTGEIGETGRDGGHAYGQWSSLAFAAEVLWKQGIDVYSEMDNRLLAAGEYYARNDIGLLGAFVPYGTIDAVYWAPNPIIGWPAPRRGMAILHGAYAVRKGLSSPYLERVRQALPVDSSNWMFEKSADNSTATPLAPVAFPSSTLASAGLTDVNIGGAAPAGGSSYSNGVWTVSGGGSEIWTHGNDSCHFTYKQVTGDCTIIAKVETETNPSNSAKVGVMIRSDLTSSAAKRAWMGVRPDHQMEYYQHGWTPGGVWGGSNWEKGIRSFPAVNSYWLKIERVGQVISLFASVDGSSWAAINAGEYTDMPATAYIGLVVCSLVNGTPITATFSNVRITGGNGVALVAAPSAAMGVCASAGDRQALVRWLGSANASGYKIKRATTSGGPYTTVATVVGNSYTDTSVTNGATYYYVVSAVNSVGESGDSPEDVATPQISMVNVAVNGTASASAGSTGSQGSAMAFDSNTGSKWFTGDSAPTGWLRYDFGAGVAHIVTSYAISAADDMPQRDPSAWQFQGSDNGSSWITLDTRSGQSFDYRYQVKTYLVANSTAYRYYRINITANTDAAYGLQLSEFALLMPTVPVPPPDAPSAASATAVSDTRIDLSWAGSMDASSYIIKRALVSGGPYTVIASGVNGTTFSSTGLAPNTTYFYVVSALGVGGESASSAQTAATTLLGPPQNVVATPGAQQIALSWSAVSGATGYNIKRSLVSGGPYSPIASGLPGTSYTDTELVNGNPYYYVISAVKDGLESHDSTELSVAPGVVTSDWFTELFSESDNDTANSTFTFTPASNANGYIASRAAASAFPTDPTGGTTLTLGDDANAAVTLSGGQQVALYGVNYPTFYVGSNGYITFGGGDTAYSEILSNHFNKPRISPLFRDFNPSSTGTISWKQSSDCVAVTWQNVPEYNTTNSNNFQVEMFFDGRVRITILAIATKAGLIGLSRGTGTPVGFAESNFSAYAALPSAPNGVTIAGGSGQVGLSWAAVSGATGYRISRSSSSSGGYVVVAAVSGSSYVDTGLSDGTTYFYTISALNAAGEGVGSTATGAVTYTALENWRQANFGTITNSGDAADSADPDGDGQTNTQEYAAGTDPKNTTSVLRVSAVVVNGNDLVVSFPSVSGRTYRLESSDTLQGGSWTTVQDDISGIDGVIAVTDVGAAMQNKRFYRIALKP